jgi:hypothetical protein
MAGARRDLDLSQYASRADLRARAVGRDDRAHRNGDPPRLASGPGDLANPADSQRRGRLEFARARGGEPCSDVFGGSWTWSGDPEALGLEQEGPIVLFSDYPNAFERVAGVLDLDQSGELWVTAGPGCEFEVPGGEAHVGGASHGALHKLDSLSPVIVAGAGAHGVLPRHMRLVDIAPLCMQLVGVPMRYKVGDPRP